MKRFIYEPPGFVFTSFSEKQTTKFYKANPANRPADGLPNNGKQ